MNEGMKVIFLDIDGVLNGYNFWNILGWKIVRRINSNHLKGWYRKLTCPHGVHKRKVRLLAKIVHKTGAKVVISSCWRFSLKLGENLSDDELKLLRLFHKYHIDIYDYTPSLPSGVREKEILAWIFRNPDVGSFVVLDDDNGDLQYLVKKGLLVQTSSFMESRLLGGNGYVTAGLNRKYMKEAIKILNK